jgi:hypothetical protein
LTLCDGGEKRVESAGDLPDMGHIEELREPII